jgi:methionine-gamma-lyase
MSEHSHDQHGHSHTPLPPDGPELRQAGFATRSVHAGQPRDEYGSVSPAVYQTSTFAFRDSEHGAACFSDRSAGYVYSRFGGPNSNMLEDAVASLEGGARAMAFATGMSAINFLFYALLSQGDHIVVSESIYAPTRLTLDKHWRRFGVESTAVDSSDLDALRAAIRPNTVHIHIETPANPNLKITDIAGAAEIAHTAGVRLSVDNTMIGPALQRPLELGADIVMESVTKFINGHSDIVGGVLAFKDGALADELYKPAYTFGASMDPHQAWLVQRGLKTLPLRCLKAQWNAQRIAAFLDKHPAVERVHYPGLESHPGYELHARQAEGPGSLISFELKGGLAAGRALQDSVRVMILAVSLGGVDTLVCHPASMTHVGLTPQQRAEAGIAEGLVRLSVGIEDVADLIADLDQALGRAEQAAG